MSGQPSIVTLSDADEPVASTSQLPAPAPLDSTKDDEDVLSDTTSPARPDEKGKQRERSAGAEELQEEDAEARKKAEREHTEEVILLAVLPQAQVVKLSLGDGITTLKDDMDVELRRDPLNAFNKNAIEVRNPEGLRIGYLHDELAARLSPLVKEKKIRLQAVAVRVPLNKIGLMSIDLCVKIHGQRQLGASPRLDWLFPGRRQHPAVEQEALLSDEDEITSDEASCRAAFEQRVERDAAMRASLLLYKENGVDMLDSMLQEGVMAPAQLPMHPSPPGKKDGTMKASLLPFQLQGLAWMVKMEHPQLPKSVDGPPVQLWKMRKDVASETFWHNIVTNSTQRDPPKLGRGGILADEMGLGKTLQTIALICTDDTSEGALDEPEPPDERYDDMTLIVCPLSVVSNWEQQLKQHVGKKRISWHLFHGKGRELTKMQLREYDVVVTTYETVTREVDGAIPTNPSEHAADPHKAHYGIYEVQPEEPPAKKLKTKSALLSIRWRRVVLDEGHLIKNPKAKMTDACMQLKAERRWILSGTPIINAASDFGTLIGFLRLCGPLDQAENWKKCVVRLPEKERGKALRAVVLSTTLRRAKNMVDATGKPLVQLPDVLFSKHEVKLSAKVRALYDEVEAEVGKGVKAAVKEGHDSSYMHILALLLRLRQLACDPSLCPADFIADLRHRKLAAQPASGLPPFSGSASTERLATLREMLRDSVDAGVDCLACEQWAVEARITTCEHFFCESCIDSAVDANGACPSCSNPLSHEDVITPSAEQSVSPVKGTRMGVQNSSSHKSGVRVERSAKVEALIRLLRSSPQGVKSLVFSQWTSHLDRIEAALREEGISTCRLDGSMQQDKREEVIRSFTLPNKTAVAGSKDGRNPMVMLLSLKAGALGLNLTVASQVFLMDPWWQPAIELQAIDRVNRIGQTQIVRVFQLVAKGTVEERVLAVQAKKDALVSQAFALSDKTVPGANSKIAPNDLASIFSVRK